MKTSSTVLIHLAAWLTFTLLCAFFEVSTESGTYTFAWMACIGTGWLVFRAHQRRELGSDLSAWWAVGAALLFLPLALLTISLIIANPNGSVLGRMIDVLPLLGALMAFSRLLDHLLLRQLPHYQPDFAHAH
jgi:hypothetical protein